MWKPMVLLWLFGVCLRLTVLAIPPIIPLLHQSFSLSQTEIGALGTLPVLLLSFAALPGAFLIGRFGAVRVLIGGIVVAGIGSALRAASLDTPTLFATTFLMGVGIAIMQPALPSIVREWVPRDIGLATAVYSNGLLVGEAISASFTIPWMLPLVDNSWRMSLVAWSMPMFVIAALGVWYARGRAASTLSARTGIWWPDWGSPFTWKLGFIAGGCSSLYFGTNAFLPDYLHRLGRADLVAPALASLNWVQLPASFLLLAFPNRLMMRRWPLAAAGVLATVAMVGLLTSTSGVWLVFWSGIIGFCTAFVLILTLALPPMVIEPARVHAVSAAVFAIGYLCAVVTPVIGGLAWDLTGLPWIAFLPAALFGPAIVVLSLALSLPRGRPGRN